MFESVCLTSGSPDAGRHVRGQLEYEIGTGYEPFVEGSGLGCDTLSVESGNAASVLSAGLQSPRSNWPNQLIPRFRSPLGIPPRPRYSCYALVTVYFRMSLFFLSTVTWFL